MLIKMTYSGSTDSQFTNGLDYTILGFSTDGSGEALGVFLADGGKVVARKVQGSADWDLLSVTAITPLLLYP